MVTSIDPVTVVETDITVKGDRIESLGPAAPSLDRRDCSGCLVMPGNVCAHTHVYSALARGAPYDLEPPSNFLQILQRIWWRLDRALDEDSIRSSAMAAAMGALRSGTTTIIDHHASPNAIDGSLDVIAETLQEVGLRSVLCYEVTDRDGPERARAGLVENRRFLRSRHRMARGMVGAHASFTLSQETLAACVDLARETGAGIHVHVAEDALDQRHCVARHGKRVLQRFQDAGALGPEALLIHCVHLDEIEMEILEASGASVAHNPTSNMNNSIGRAPVRRIKDRVVIGTDGIGANMMDESRTAYFRLREDDPTVGITWPLERMAANARLAGRLFGEPLLGTIAPGAPADLVVLEYPSPTPVSAGNLAGHWVFGLDSLLVRDVMVAGEWSLLGFRMAAMDQDQIGAEATCVSIDLWERLAEIGPHRFDPMEGL